MNYEVMHTTEIASLSIIRLNMSNICQLLLNST